MKAKLKCTIIDDETGKMIPARVSIEDRGENYYSPPDAFSYGMNMPREWPSDWGIKGQKMYFYTDGEFNLTVPIGIVRVRVIHGYEYPPFDKMIEIFQEGKVITIKLKRIIDMPAIGWFCGDNHVHLTHSPKEYDLGPKEGLFLARAEGLNIVSFLDPLYRDISCSDKTAKSHIHFRRELGHHVVLSLRKKLPKNLICNFKQANDWIYLNDRYHHECGIIGIGHPVSSNHLFSGLFTSDKAIANMCHYELPISIALGNADTFDLQNNRLSTLRIWIRVWYSLLNCGFRIPLSAGTDSCHSVKTTLPLGIYRVYVNSNTADYEKWLQGLKKGESFITDGPMLFLRINGLGIGETIYFNKNDKTCLNIEIRAISGYCMDDIELIQNGKIVKKWKLNQLKKFKVKYLIKISKSSWFALRVYRERGNDLREKELFAHTSPIYVICSQNKISSSKDAMFFLEWIDYYCQLRIDKDDLKNRNILDVIEKSRKEYLWQLTSSAKKDYLPRRKKIKSIKIDDFKETGSNCIKNPGFKGKSIPYHWEVGDESKLAIKKESSSNCLELMRKKKEKYTVSICYQNVAVKPETYYILKGEIKRGLGKDAVDRGGYTLARIVVMDENGNYLGAVSDETRGVRWVEASTLIYTEKNAREVMIACYIEYGKVYFRNISLKECKGPFLNLI